MRLAIFYGSTTGNTKRVAEQLATALGGPPLFDVQETKPAEFLNHDVLVLGIPTWHIGDMQDDWATMLPKLADLDLAGKRVAFFGLGDSSGYPDTFGDALGEAWIILRSRGATLVGVWPTTGYSFDDSKGKYDADHFLGLMLDEDGEGWMTSERMTGWVEKLKTELVAT